MRCLGCCQAAHRPRLEQQMGPSWPPAPPPAERRRHPGPEPRGGHHLVSGGQASAAQAAERRAAGGAVAGGAGCGRSERCSYRRPCGLPQPAAAGEHRGIGRKAGEQEGGMGAALRMWAHPPVPPFVRKPGAPCCAAPPRLWSGPCTGQCFRRNAQQPRNSGEPRCRLRNSLLCWPRRLGRLRSRPSRPPTLYRLHSFFPAPC